MDSSLLTKCPHCKTLFRIHYDHLAVADGEVRCGICYKVFNAQEEGLSYSEGPGMLAGETFRHTEPERPVKPDPSLNPVIPEQPDLSTELDPLAEPGDLVDSPEAKVKQQPAETDKLAKPVHGNDSEIIEETSIDDKSVDEVSSYQSPSIEEINKLNIQEESVENLLSEQATVKKLQRPLLWGTLSFMALMLLGLQWAWFQKDNYALMHQWRPWYQNVCEIVGCPVPPYSKPELLEIERLAIKSHKEYTNVLIIDLIMSNYGAYPQPFPSLALSFYDINGVALAGRTFTPDDYLKGQAAILKEMPTQSPIHISFDILDPGKKAVNYDIQIRPVL